jgi:hypothetical protein
VTLASVLAADAGQTIHKRRLRNKKALRDVSAAPSIDDLDQVSS